MARQHRHLVQRGIDLIGRVARTRHGFLQRELPLFEGLPGKLPGVPHVVLDGALPARLSLLKRSRHHVLKQLVPHVLGEGYASPRPNHSTTSKEFSKPPGLCLGSSLGQVHPRSFRRKLACGRLPHRLGDDRVEDVLPALRGLRIQCRCRRLVGNLLKCLCGLLMRGSSEACGVLHRGDDEVDLVLVEWPAHRSFSAHYALVECGPPPRPRRIPDPLSRVPTKGALLRFAERAACPLLQRGKHVSSGLAGFVEDVLRGGGWRKLAELPRFWGLRHVGDNLLCRLLASPALRRCLRLCVDDPLQRLGCRRPSALSRQLCGIERGDDVADFRLREGPAQLRLRRDNPLVHLRPRTHSRRHCLCKPLARADALRGDSRCRGRRSAHPVLDAPLQVVAQCDKRLL